MVINFVTSKLTLTILMHNKFQVNGWGEEGVIKKAGDGRIYNHLQIYGARDQDIICQMGERYRKLK